jgi:serine/threonine protein kinase
MAVSTWLGWFYHYVCGLSKPILENVLAYATGAQIVWACQFRQGWKREKFLKYPADCGAPSCSVELGTIKGNTFGKVVVKDRAYPPECADQLDNEFTILLQSFLTPHPNIVLPTTIVLDVEIDDDELFGSMWVSSLVLPYVGNQNLSDYMLQQRWGDATPLWSPRVVSDLFKQILGGLAHLHAYGIVHHDFCNENIIVNVSSDEQRTDGSLHLTICDFGVAEYVDAVSGHADPQRRSCGRVRNMAPEQRDESTVPITTQLDMFGLFMVGQSIIYSGRSIGSQQVPKLEEMIQNKEIVQQLFVDKVPLETVLERFYNFPPRTLTNLIDRCKHADPEQRPTAQHALNIVNQFASALPPK